MPARKTTTPRKTTARKAAQPAPELEPADAPAGLVFTTADLDPEPKQEQPGDVVPVTVDGETWTARRPKDARFGLLAAAAEEGGNALNAETFKFLQAALGDDYDRMQARFDDDGDAFDYGHAAQIMVQLVNHWVPEHSQANRAARRAAARRR